MVRQAAFSADQSASALWQGDGGGTAVEYSAQEYIWCWRDAAGRGALRALGATLIGGRAIKVDTNILLPTSRWHGPTKTGARANC
jgi:hypothetical protein